MTDVELIISSLKLKLLLKCNMTIQIIHLALLVGFNAVTAWIFGVYIANLQQWQVLIIQEMILYLTF